MPQNSQANSQLRLHFVVFIWGFTAILGDLISLDSIPLVWNRILITILSLILYLWLKKSNFKIDFEAFKTFALAGVIIAAHWITFFHAIKISNVSITLVCMSSGAFFTSLLEPLFFKRKIHLFELILGLVVVASIALIFSAEINYLWGILTALLSAFLSALFSVINGKIVHKYESEIITFYELLLGWIAITILLLFTGQLNTSLFPVTRSDWIYLIVLGSVCTAYPFVESVRVMKNLSPFTVILTITMEPVYGIILAYLLLGDKEKMTPTFYIGAVVIISTLFLNAYMRKRLKAREA